MHYYLKLEIMLIWKHKKYLFCNIWLSPKPFLYCLGSKYQYSKDIDHSSEKNSSILNNELQKPMILFKATNIMKFDVKITLENILFFVGKSINKQVPSTFYDWFTLSGNLLKKVSVLTPLLLLVILYLHYLTIMLSF